MYPGTATLTLLQVQLVCKRFETHSLAIVPLLPSSTSAWGPCTLCVFSLGTIGKEIVANAAATRGMVCEIPLQHEVYKLYAIQ